MKYFYSIIISFLILSVCPINYSQDATSKTPNDYLPGSHVFVDKPVKIKQVERTHQHEIMQTDEYGEDQENRVLGSLGPGRFVTVMDNIKLEKFIVGTMEAWVFPTSQTTTHMIASKGAFDFFWGVRSGIGNRMVLTIGGTQLENTSGYVVPLNSWSHLAVSWSISGGNITASFYINGSASGTPVTLPGAWVNNSTDLRLGNWHGGVSNFWAGFIDEVRLWDDERTQTEIAENRFVGFGDGFGSNTGGALTSSNNLSRLTANWSFNMARPECFEDINNLHGAYSSGAGSIGLGIKGIPIPYNFALRLFGAPTDRVHIPDAPAFDLTSAGSIDAWVYTTKTGAQTIIQKGISQPTQTIRFGFNNNLFFQIGSGIIISNGVPVPTNSWNHVAVTWSGGPNFQCTFYLNGQVNGTGTISQAMPVNSHPAWIGNTAWSTNSTMTGYLDEVRLWNIALTATLVVENMHNSCRASNMAGLVAAWNFDGNLLSFGLATGLDGTFNVGGINNCRFSGFLNENLIGPPSNGFISHATVLNKNMPISPFPGGFAMRSPNKHITDNATQFDTLVISGSGTVTSVEVFLSIRHTYTADLDITLRAPNGVARDLTSDNGGKGDHILTLLSDGAVNNVTNPNFFPPWSNIAAPEFAMGSFGNSPTNGQWILEVTDDLIGEVGVLRGWGIRLNGSDTRLTQVSENIPERFALLQNYPNPFNPVTKIKFDIAEVSNVKILVYDMLGREVKTLVNETMQSGEYEIPFDGSNLASGTYFFRIEAGNFKDVKKMILIK